MTYKQVTVYTVTEGAELVADLFCDCYQGVCISDKNDILALIREGRVWDYIDDSLYSGMTDVVLVSGFLSSERFEEEYAKLLSKIERLRENAAGQIPLGSLETAVRDVDGEDWFNVWKKYYKVIEIGGVAVVPVWEKYDGDKAVVLIDPGMAFGTGEHETTSLCIGMMQKINLAGKRVIDIGCGSGILGIAAAKLGAASCYLCDIDPVAVDAARMNARLNDCLGVCRVECRDLLAGSDERADVILINIVADVLVSFSDKIRPHLREGGHVVLSGIIHARCDDVVRAYEAQGFTLKEKLSKGEWDSLLFSA